MSRAPIHAAYQRLVDKGRLFPNPSQHALVARLGQLQDALSSSSSSVDDDFTGLTRTPVTTGDGNGEMIAGVYIYGDVGTGKSRVADLFARTVPTNVSRRRVHFHEFMMDIHERLHLARSRSGYGGDPLRQIGAEVRGESRVLCFDEFQVSDIADAMILKRLFGSIWAAGGVVVATSNRHPDRLYEKGLNRPLFVPFIEELQRQCEVWKMEGKQDYRMQTQGKHELRDQVFFTDRPAFDESLRTNVHGEELSAMTIPVMMGRELRVAACRPADRKKFIVYSTFKDLCEKNLGSSDYYALCKKADVLYLPGIRQFREDELDFVRRFITLCDLAYENRTRIVCLSEVPLFEVFQKIVPTDHLADVSGVQQKMEEMSVRKGGGASSSMMSTFIGEMEWSATGLPASLASGGAGETDVKFAIGRAISRLFEMGSHSYTVTD